MRKVHIFMTVLLAMGYQASCKKVSYVQGQEAKLTFPYPCESTYITLQQSNRLPFYNSADGLTLSLHEDQRQRFNIHNDDCYLKLTIINVKRVDQGTYILSVYKNQMLISDVTYKIWLNIDYPPGKASCVVDGDKGGKWVSIDCKAKTGSLPGKIECYQDGEWMPPLTGPTETHNTLKQTILIRKSQSAFCCSSLLNGNKSRDECDDTGLFLEGTRSNDLSATISMRTTTGSQDPKEITKTFDSRQYHFSTKSFSTNGLKKSKHDLKHVFIYCGLATAVLLLLIMNVILLFKMRIMHKNINDTKSDDRCPGNKLDTNHNVKNV